MGLNAEGAGMTSCFFILCFYVFRGRIMVQYASFRQGWAVSGEKDSSEPACRMSLEQQGHGNEKDADIDSVCDILGL